MINTFDDVIRIAESQAHSIPFIKDETNFWMIRSKQGIFYREFIDKEFIAIGWNVLSDTEIDNDDDTLKERIANAGYRDKMPGMAVNKCRRFVDEIKANDIAVIVGRNEIAFAHIGDYFEHNDSSTTVEKEIEVISRIERGNYVSADCPYRKRRHIRVITRINIDLVSPTIYRCLVANRHSLSNLNEYADAIISASYDVAYYKDRLIVKYHVGQARDINPFDFSIFTLNVVNLLTENEREIIGKYNINSEGEVVLFLVNAGKEAYEFIKDNIAAVWVVYTILFGGKGFGFELPSAVEKIRGWVTDILYRKETKRIRKAAADKAEAEAAKSQAEADKAKAEVAKIKAETEQTLVDTEIKKINLEELREEKRKDAIRTIMQLQQASEPLQIQMPSQEIISLVMALNETTKE